MRIITCASYFGTGSSAVTDYFSEYKGVSSLGRYEYRFIQDPDGIADLEYNVVENNHRHNTSEAIKKYIAFTKKFNSFGYGNGYKVFGDYFNLRTEQYINEITELKAKSWFHMNRIDKGELFCIIDRAYSLCQRLLHGGLHTERKYSLLTKTEWGYFTAISEEQFLKATRSYIDDLIDHVNVDKSQYVMVDQLVPATNTARYLRYFNDVKIVAVDRDPRDVYLCEKTKYQWGVVPTKTVEEYVEWFRITRKYSRPTDEDISRVKRVRFEDMVYNYDKTTDELREFIGLKKEDHIRPKTKFDPARSIKNTNLKSKIDGYAEEIKYIEDHLSDYLFDFERYKK